MHKWTLAAIATLMTGCTTTINNPVINADTKVNQQQGVPVMTAGQVAPQTVIVNQQINIVQQNQQNNIGVSAGPAPVPPTQTAPDAIEWRSVDSGFVKMKFPSNWVLGQTSPDSQRSHPLAIFLRAGGGALGFYQIKDGSSASSNADSATLYAGAGLIARRTRLVGGKSADFVLMADPVSGGRTLIMDLYVEAGGLVFEFLLTANNDTSADTIAGEVGRMLDSVEWGPMPNLAAPTPTPIATSAPAQPPTVTNDATGLCDTLKARGLDGSTYGCAPVASPTPTPAPTPTPPSPTPTPAPDTPVSPAATATPSQQL